MSRRKLSLSCLFVASFVLSPLFLQVLPTVHAKSPLYEPVQPCSVVDENNLTQDNADNAPSGPVIITQITGYRVPRDWASLTSPKLVLEPEKISPSSRETEMSSRSDRLLAKRIAKMIPGLSEKGAFFRIKNTPDEVTIGCFGQELFQMLSEQLRESPDVQRFMCPQISSISGQTAMIVTTSSEKGMYMEQTATLDEQGSIHLQFQNVRFERQEETQTDLVFIQGEEKQVEKAPPLFEVNRMNASLTIPENKAVVFQVLDSPNDEQMIIFIYQCQVVPSEPTQVAIKAGKE